MDKIIDLQMVIAVIIFIVFATSTQASVLKTDTIPTKCVVRIKSQEVIKNIGDTWITNNTNTSCIKHSCDVDDNGTPHESLTKESCPLIECKNGFEYLLKSGNCCGECVQRKCKYEGKFYKIGEFWKSVDSCMMLECVADIDNDGKALIQAYKLSCPEFPDNCPKENIYEKDCCWYCKKDNSTRKSNVIDKSNFEIENAYKSHPCKRECLSNTEPMDCYYKFEVEWYETLSKACYDCPYNLSDCYRPHCIIGDGERRSILVVNRMMPGPSIEVCHNDTIIVDVVNELLGDSTTIHWHGLQQRETPYMDGVPHISQCPIQPHTTFRYTFKAAHPGTHFWHSHTGMQRGDGCFGPLIIRQPYSKDPQAEHYDFDLSEHVIVLQDWGHITGTSMFASHHHSIGSNKPPNILVNGFGRFYNAEIQKTLAPSISSTSTTNPPEITKFITTDEITTENENKIDLSTTIVTETVVPYDIEFYQDNPNHDMRLEKTKNFTRTKRSIKDPMKFPLKIFTVQKGYSYRFRVINAEFLNCPVAISVDNHTLLVISSDGFDLEPVEVTSLVTYAGERFDFTLKANQKIDNYWIRFKGLMDCDERFTSAHQAAILHYEGASNDEPITGISPTYNYTTNGLELNSLNKGPGQVDSLVISELNALQSDEDWLNENRKPDYKFYIYYDFYPKDNPHFHVPNLYGFNQVNNTIDNKLFTPQLNHISLKMPSVPLMPARDQLDETQFCNSTSLAAKGIDCRKEFCECHHVLQVKLGAIVEMVLIDEGLTYDANHPFHLHGNAFRVIGMDRLKKNVTVEEIKKMDEDGLLPRRFEKAPIKDTVTIPDGGYTIIRFKADNPGYWLFHCHIEFHAEIGMALVIKIGDHNQMVPVPEGFPTCSNYMPKTNERSKIVTHKSSNGNHSTIINLSLTTILLAIIRLWNTFSC